MKKFHDVVFILSLVVLQQTVTTRVTILKRVLSLAVLTALLLPMVLLQPIYKVSAGNLPIQPMPAIITAPPEPFSVGSSSWRLATQINTWFASFFSVSAAPKVIKGIENGLRVESQSLAVESQELREASKLNSSSTLNSGTLNSETSSNLLLPAGTVSFDFDGDGKADHARWQSTTTDWKIKQSLSNTTVSTLIGTAGAKAVPGDYDGDSKTDIAVFKDGTWTIKKSFDNSTQTISFGQAGDKPVVGDYDGDGLADVAVYRNGTWYIRNSTNNSTTTYSFGISSDIPIVGNFDNDSKTDIVVFRPSTGDWHSLLSQSGYGYSAFHWGISTDIPVAADYDGDNKTDYAVYRGITGTWYVYKSSSTNGEYIAQTWGNYGDQPVPADYDGDGKADFTVWRPTTGIWYSINSSNQNYNNKTLGMAGDVAVESAYLKQIGSTVSNYDLAKARLSPKNETGGTSLYSRNFGWGTGLAGLSGRGLNAGFGMSYNSLIWTKQDNTMIFDADNSNITAGFRFGFPVIEPSYFDSQTGQFNYLLVSPSGGRTEFKQDGASKFFYTADSSYTQLKINGSDSPNDIENATITVSSTDGTKMEFEWKAGAFRAKQVKDRNGNYITIVHNDFGLLQTVTDTLERVINVNYDADYYPISVTQTWKDNNGSGSNITHTYATFSYTNQTINTNFATSLSVYGPPNGYQLKVLDKVTFTDNSFTQFEYNSYGQVWKINNHAIDQHKLNHVSVNLPSPSANQTDCPRFTETHSWVENFNRLNGTGAEQEVIIYNDFQENQPYTIPTGGSGSGNLIQITSPDGNGGTIVSKTFTGTTGWREGLPILTEDYANGVKKRWSWTNYTQDVESLSYIKNPRVTETKVGDTENNFVRKTTVDYWTDYGLTKEVKVYDTDQSTVLKKSYTEYNLDAVYINKRIIGLPSKTKSWGNENGLLKLTSKTTYAYDEDNFSYLPSEQNIAPIQHDNTNYGASFINGRGNLTSTKNWNTDFENDVSQAIIGNTIKYNTAGNPIASIDVLGRTIKTSYADKFNDGNNNRNTFAYPTKLTDPNGNFSEVKYRFDIGANVWARSPSPIANTYGKETTREYDNYGRPTKETLVNTGAYTRYEYPTNQVNSKVYTTITDTNNNNTGDTADEVLSESWTDGAGRTRMARSEHPNSVGGYSGSMVEYDILGRVKRSSVPTEINASWQPSGDDASRGFLWTSQEYDWKGRPIREINTDGTDKLISYNGCGCAGGQVTTIQSELVPRDDIPNQNARRTQKVYADILGRTYKTESMKWDGSVYSTNLTNFNAADQVVSAIQQDNSVSPMVSQTTTMTYDGFGRMKTQHRPEQNANTNTVYNYHLDGRVQSMVDARGAITNYEYIQSGANVGQLSQVSYAVPSGSNIPVTPTVTYSYNNLGMRTSMQDGLGTQGYVYNNLGQLTSETRQFNDTLANAPLANNSFKLEYGYTMNGQLKSLKDPFGQQINYEFDKVGRLTNVTGSTAFNGITNYASTPTYNARGILTHLNYGNGVEMNINNFNNKLQATNFEIKKNSTIIQKKNYEFYNDGALKYSQDVNDAKFDRLYQYDFEGRTTEAKSGANARGQTDNETNIPYYQQFSYNAFSNMTTSNMRHFSSSTDYQNNTYTNNRKISSSSIYDAEGNEISDLNSIYDFDAAGELVKTTPREEDGSSNLLPPTIRQIDGTGKEIKRYRTWLSPYNQQTYNFTNYYIYSSVTGKLISETNETGQKLKTYVSANGQTLAEQSIHYTNPTAEHIAFNHQDASGASLQQTKADGTPLIGNTSGTYIGRVSEFDAVGNNVGDADPYLILAGPPNEGDSSTNLTNSAYGFDNQGNPHLRQKYLRDGIEVPESDFRRMIDIGAIGGTFGILQMTARMSIKVMSFSAGGKHFSPDGEGFANAMAHASENHIGTVYRNFSDSWSFSSALILQIDTKKYINEQDCVKALIDSITSEYKTLAKKFKKQMTKSVQALSKASQEEGLTIGQTAYLIATGVHESTAFTDFDEDYNDDRYTYFENKYGYKTDKGKELGNTVKGDGDTYRGQGIIQVTGKNNYQRVKDSFGIDVVKNPGKLQSDIQFSARVAARGIAKGWFGNKISRHIDKDGENWKNARNSVNSGDHDYRNDIAERAKNYYGLLKKCQQ